MKYPQDFKVFNGKALSSEEIDSLVHAALRIESDLCATGDILVDIDEGKNITIWQQKAYYTNPK
jgi:hypothetical protein